MTSVEDLITGFKFKLPEKRHSPQRARDDHMRASVVVNAVHVLEEPSLILGERGKKRFSSTYSSSQDFEKGKRHLTPPKRVESPPRGKRHIAPPPSQGEDSGFQSKRHLLDCFTKTSDTTDLPKIGWKKKGQVIDESGTPVGRKASDEHKLETAMNRKQRVISEVDRRNGIPVARPADHSYKQAEQESGFYAQGGLISGSTNTLRASAKPTLRKNENSSSQVTNKKLEATYAKTKARLEMEYDLAQVHALSIPGTKQGQVVPSWEQRTGCFLVAPEDEAF